MIRRRFLTPPALIFALTVALLSSSGYVPVQALTPGKDGSLTVTAANTIVNTYTTLAASALAGGTSIQVGSAAVLGAAPGDLLLIVQMQGVSMNATDSALYGAITNYSNVGNYEFVTVYGVSGNTITFCPCGGGLQRSYTVRAGAAGTGPSRAQVIRVPQYTTLTINAGASIAAPAWNGATGGIVAVHAQNTVTINGAIDVSGRGFRGGVRDNLTSPQGNTIYSTFISANSTSGGEKGESIFGFQADYDSFANGRYSRGAPANGGGGGNAHNAGGGGGANGDNGVAWNGQGNPDTSVAGWITAWNLESAGFANNTSSGGGRGGYTFGGSDANALTVGPGDSNWGGDWRDNTGGWGGRPLDNTGNRYFMGGGGGAGDGNNSASSDGAAGGGMVFLVTLPTGTVTGTGQIRANGADAPQTVASGNDAPGGGGGGGSVVVSAGTLGGITIQANGGRGGNQVITINNESEGPGGGGGGGVIATSGGAVSTSVSGAANGTTNSTAVTEFIPNGATRGATGRILTASVTIPTTACLGVAKAAVSVSSANPFNITFAVVVQNLGTEPLNNVQVTDNVAAVFSPNAVTVTGAPSVTLTGSGSLTGNPAYNGSTDTNLLNAGGTLGVGASATITFTIQVNAPSGGVFSNSATGTATGAVSGGAASDVSQNGNNPDPDGDGNPGNNSAPTPITVAPVLSPATLNKVFNPANGVPSTLTITLTNPNGSALTGATLIDNLPAGVTTVGSEATTCAPGTATRTATSISLSNGTIPAGGSCTLSVQVTAVASGTYTNTLGVGSLATTQGVTNSAPASATLTINTNAAPLVSKAFNPPEIASGGVSQMTIVITNPNGGALTGAAISDTFPASVLFSTPSAVNNGCGGTVTLDTTAPGIGFSITGMTIPASGSCTITTNVSSTTPGPAVTNTTSAVTSPGNPASATASATLLVSPALPTTDLSVTKTGTPTVLVGGAVTYTVLIRNLGPSAASGASFSDSAPAGISITSATCGTPTGGAVCGAVNTAGQNVTSTVTTLPSGGTVTITINGTATTAGSITNTASIAPPSGVNDSNTANDQSSQATNITPVSNVSVTKTSPATVNAGGSISYTIVIGNAGPSAANGTTFSDSVPAGISITSATCGTPTGGAACGAVNTAGQSVTSTVTTLPSGGTVTITINGTVTASGGSLSNTATVAPPTGTTDPTPGNNSATANTTVNPVADLALNKTGTATVLQNGAVTYTITVTNLGPLNVTGATITDTVPANVTGVNWTCTAAGTATCGTPSGIGNAISLTGDIAAGAGNSLTIVVSGTASGGDISNTATVAVPSGVTDPAAGNDSATANTTVGPVADLSITKTGTATVLQNGAVTYTITVTNLGPSNVTGASISDMVPVNVAGVTWTCTAAGTATCGTPSGIGNAISLMGDISAGAGNSLTIAVSGTAAGGDISNTATVAPPAGTTDPTPGNDSATANTTVNPVADLAITKTGTATVSQGGAVSYTLVVTNLGPSNVTGATITDTVPANVTGVNWTCTAAGTASCGTAGGTGNAINLTGDINAGAGNSLTITVSGTASGGNISNTATVAVPSGTTDPAVGNDTATANTTVTAVADLALTKTGTATVLQNGAVTYTITVTNLGPSNVTGASITDTVPANVTGVTWTCTAAGTASCGTEAGSGNAISLTGDIAVGAGNSLTITVSGTASGGDISNTASVAPPTGVTDPAAGNNTATANTTVIPVADLAIAKTGTATVSQGSAVSYTLVVTNLGPSNVTGASISDTVPSNVTGVNWSCTAAGTATCGTAAGSGNAISLTGDIAAGAGNSLTITVSGTASGGDISNTATVAAPSGTTDPTPGNNSATGNTAVNPVADLSITKTGTATVSQGGAVSYTLVVTNLGPSNVTGARISDTVPANVTGVNWSCTAAGTAMCGTPSGTGNVISLTGDIAAGAGNSLTITVSGTASGGDISNTASVAPPSGVTDSVAGNDTATANTSVNPVADLAITKTGTATALQSGGVSYTLFVTNLGLSNVTGAAVTDTVPANVTGVTWTCTVAGTATCGALSGTGNVISLTGDIAAGAGNSLTITVSGTASGGDISNTANVTAPGGVTDPASGNNTATANTTVGPVADLSISKTGAATVNLGGGVSYTLVVTNLGPSNVTGATVTDTVPANVTGVTWTCTAAGTTTCGTPSGSGNAVSLTGDIAAGAGNSLTITVSGTASAAGSISNSAGVALPSGVTDPDATNNTANQDTVISANAEIAGFAWQDGNNNGIQDTGELGLGGVTVRLYRTGDTTPFLTNTSSVAGVYQFTNVPPGDYFLEYVLPGGYTYSPQDQGGNDALDSDVNPATNRTATFTLVSGVTDTSLDAGLTAASTTATVGGSAWLDANGDGIQDTGEGVLAGMTVNLYLSDGTTLVDTAVTDPLGTYIFPNLAPGSYIVEFVQPGGYTFSPQDQGGNDALDSDPNPATGRTSVITLAAGANDQSVDAGLVGNAPVTVTDFVWLDTNGNGVQDAGEPGAGGVTVRLLRSDGSLVGTTVTDPTGTVIFLNLLPGDYFVEFVLPGGYLFAPADQGGDDALDSDANLPTGRTPVTTIGAGGNNTLDAGLTGPELATAGGTVWVDGNGNGIQEPGEPGQDGVTVRIYMPGGYLVATTTTSGGGLYSVPNLVAGDYVVEYVLPGSHAFSPADQGGDDTLDSDVNPPTGRTAAITLTGGQVNDTIDAGLTPSATGATPAPAPAIGVFDPALSKIGVLEIGALGLPGEQVTWIFTITNVGSAAGTNIVLTDTLRPELRIDSADIDRGSVTVNGQTVTFNLLSLNPGESVQARVRTTVLIRPDGTTIDNAGVLTGTGSSGELIRRVAAAVIDVPGTLPATGYPPSPEPPALALVVVAGAVGLALAGLLALRRRRAR